MKNLQHLIDYFNDRYELENQVSFRPFFLRDGLVSGRFGPVCLSSAFTAVRDSQDHERIVGHIAQLSVVNNDFTQIQTVAAGNLLNQVINQPADLVTIINFDRLSRTVHLLNYLTIAHLDTKLFLDVDPRHILAVKYGHGTYFEEVLIKCGLKTSSIVLGMNLNSQYADDFDSLLEGLNNYRSRGYQIALNSQFGAGKVESAFIEKAVPDYLRVTAPELANGNLQLAIDWLEQLQAVSQQIEVETIFQQVESEIQSTLANKVGFKLVQGGFYDRPLIDHLRCL